MTDYYNVKRKDIALENDSSFSQASQREAGIIDLHILQTREASIRKEIETGIASFQNTDL